MRNAIALLTLLATLALVSGCGGDDDDGGKLACEGTGACMTAAECSESAQTPANPGNGEYDCPAGRICCVLIDGGADGGTDD
jgi:hypothetical protein